MSIKPEQMFIQWEGILFNSDSVNRFFMIYFKSLLFHNINKNNIKKCIFMENICYIQISENQPPIQLEASQQQTSSQREILIDKLKLVNSWNVERDAPEVLSLLPEDMDSEEFAELVFEHVNLESSGLLEEIKKLRPEFVLSPFNQIRKAILDDEDNHNITNDSLNEMIQSLGVEMNEQRWDICYKLAFRVANPNIFQLALIPVRTDEFTLHFVWVNRDPQDRIKDVALNIFGVGEDERENAVCANPALLEERNEEKLEGEELEICKSFKDTYSYKLIRWAERHPNARMFLWSDFAILTHRAVQNTIQMMKEISASKKVDLKLMNVRSLIGVKGEIENALHPKVPVFNRVDLVKELIPDHMMSVPNEKAKYTVVLDFDIEPMPAHQLFDQRTVDNLSTYGYVFHKNQHAETENSLSIYNRERIGIQEAHYKIFILAFEKEIRSRRKNPIQREYLDSQFFYRRYYKFAGRNSLDLQDLPHEDFHYPPRKIAKSPCSQFKHAQFPETDHRSETFYFAGNDTTPTVENGRAINCTEEVRALLDNWKLEPSQPTV